MNPTDNSPTPDVNTNHSPNHQASTAPGYAVDPLDSLPPEMRMLVDQRVNAAAAAARRSARTGNPNAAATQAVVETSSLASRAAAFAAAGYSAEEIAQYASNPAYAIPAPPPASVHGTPGRSGYVPTPAPYRAGAAWAPAMPGAAPPATPVITGDTPLLTILRSDPAQLQALARRDPAGFSKRLTEEFKNIRVPIRR